MGVGDERRDGSVSGNYLTIYSHHFLHFIHLQEIETEHVKEHVIRRNVNKMPKDCDQNIYKIMLKCWQYETDDRASFREIVKLLLENFKKLENENEILQKFQSKSFYFSK